MTSTKMIRRLTEKNLMPKKIELRPTRVSMFTEQIWHMFTEEIASPQPISINKLPESLSEQEAIENLKQLSTPIVSDRKTSMNNIYIGFPFLLGADVEMFMKDKKGIVPPNKLGFKEDNQDKPEIFQDGMAVEFRVSHGYCRDRIVYDIAHKIINVNNTKLGKSCSMSIKTEEIGDKSRHHPNSMILGCKPDHNIYSNRMNLKTELEAKDFRTLGGHIHLGINTEMLHSQSILDWDKFNIHTDGDEVISNTIKYFEKRIKDIERLSNKDSTYYRPFGKEAEIERCKQAMNASEKAMRTLTTNKALLIKMLDAFAGIAGVLMEHDKDQARKRRSMYGAAGDYRVCPYGIEYRTLSSFWIATPIHAYLILGIVKLAAWVTFNYKDFPIHIKQMIDNILKYNTRKIINTVNVEEAKKVFAEILLLSEELHKHWGDRNGSRILLWPEIVYIKLLSPESASKIDLNEWKYISSHEGNGIWQTIWKVISEISKEEFAAWKAKPGGTSTTESGFGISFEDIVSKKIHKILKNRTYSNEWFSIKEADRTFISKELYDAYKKS